MACTQVGLPVYPPPFVMQTSTRLQTLSEIHEHQSGVIVRLTKDVKHLRRGREEVKETLDDICDVADDQRVRLLHMTRLAITPFAVTRVCLLQRRVLQ